MQYLNVNRFIKVIIMSWIPFFLRIWILVGHWKKKVFLNNLRSVICLSPSLSPGSHPCFSCKDMEGDVKRCSVNGCGRFYHDTCARKFTGTTTDTRGLRCPQHSCATCCLDRDLHKACKGTPQIYLTFRSIFLKHRDTPANLSFSFFFFLLRPYDAMYPLSGGVSHRRRLCGGWQCVDNTPHHHM